MKHRYVFVGGLHRSGTSLIARLIAGLPGIAAIVDAPVPENEGVYLQGAVPHTARDGKPMHFATDPAQHLVEGCTWDRLEVRLRLEADWDPWFGSGQWRVEKSPVNLTRMRLYQQLFPLAQFIVVLRHPEAVAASVAKWVEAEPPELIDHWLEAHRQLAADLPYLHAVLPLRYEDVVAAPYQKLERLAGFLGVEPAPVREAIHDGNVSLEAPRMTDEQAAHAAVWGYGQALTVAPISLAVQHPLRRVREAASLR